jgi:hypothetical protein
VPVTGPYPVIGIPGTTIGATQDCPAWLTDASGEVWYAINLPYAFNDLTITETSAALSNAYIVGTFVECSCLSTDYIFYTSYNFVPPTFTVLFAGLAGPGTFYYPVTAGTPQAAFTLDINVQGGTPVANITPPSFTKEVAPGASTTDLLNIGNTGTYGMSYSANVV